MMANKLGLHSYHAELNNELLNLLTQAETDMTLFFRSLAEANPADVQHIDRLAKAYYNEADLSGSLHDRISQWLGHYTATLAEQGVDETSRVTRMNKTNPKYILRNYLAQLAIDDAEQGDLRRLNETLEVLRHPYDEQPNYEAYAAKRPDWARTRVGCSMLSCSS